MLNQRVSSAKFIEIKNLSKRFNSNWIIKNLSLTINEGEIVVVQGPSGIGKSTLLRCLTYLTPFEKGYIRVGSLQLEAGMDDRKHHGTILGVRQQLGFVFQSFNLFPHLSVIDNLTIGPIKVLGQTRERARKRAMALLRRIGLKHKADEYPMALSGGQQQRVAIGRALALRPKGILFDEPTSNLDPVMKGEIVDVMEDFAQDGLTMIIVTHEPAVIERMAARIVEFGPHCSIVSERILPKLLFNTPESPKENGILPELDRAAMAQAETAKA
ncbi:MAG: amino acid ABC transporter ATP-binding protein [Elusimicrobia bacterium]|nr:amino acid ABC transporter ATP-binding protein [Elusimicrobiota bacterium]